MPHRSPNRYSPNAPKHGRDSVDDCDMGQRIRRRTTTVSDDATQALLRLAEGYDDTPDAQPLGDASAIERPLPAAPPPAAAWPATLSRALRLRTRPHGA